MFNLAVIPHFLLHYKIINTISSLRSSRPEVFCEKGVLRKFAKFLERHLCQNLFFNKVAALPVSFVKSLRTSFFIEHLCGCFLVLPNYLKFKVPLSIWDNFWHLKVWNSFKTDEKCFCFLLVIKLFSFMKYVHSCPDFLVL